MHGEWGSHRHDWDNGAESDSDNEREHHQDRHQDREDREVDEEPLEGDGMGPEEDHHHRLPPDTYFAGALGFGAEGDLCMYQHLEQLSDPCVSAVANIYELRAQYWAEDQAPPPHCPWAGLAVFGLFLLGLLLLVKKLRFMKKKKAVNEFLAAIAAQPQLKAAVEEQTRMKLPEPLGCCRGGGLLKRFCKTAAFLLVVLVSSVFIAISSLEVTAHILNHIDQSAPVEEGEAHQPMSAGAALLLLAAVCAVHVSLFFLVVRGLRYLYQRYLSPCPSP
jgi:hypothetical protein